MLKIAIIGGTGLLGSNLTKLYHTDDVKAFSRQDSHNVHQSQNIIINFTKLKSNLVQYFKSWQPDIIINAVAMVNLQTCEKNHALAYESNVKIAKDLAEVSSRLNCYFIHISTDHYYNNKKVKHSETDEISLLNNYSKTKYLAEKEVLMKNKSSLIVRTNIIGFRNNNTESFFEWLLNSLIKNNTINMYTNFFTSPISVVELSEIMIKCFNNKLSGIYNISSSEVISKYSFGVKTAEKFGLCVESIKQSELTNKPRQIQRALTLGLDTSKITKAIGDKMPTINETLESLYNEYKLKK